MLSTIRKFARASARLSSRLSAPPQVTAAELGLLREKMGSLVLDCELRVARRVRAHLDSAHTVMHLWLLRAEVYQAVAERFGQAEATRRIERLAPAFDGLLPPRQRSR